MESTLYAQDGTLRDTAPAESIYTDGTYLRNNPGWHRGDSAWKARHVKAILDRNGIAAHTVCEVGCGAGEILRNLGELMPPDTRFHGYEISPDAYRLCSQWAGERFRFLLADLLEEDVHFDVALAIDVFEHVEDYFSFLRRLRARARIPILAISTFDTDLLFVRDPHLTSAVRALERAGHRVDRGVE